MPKVSIIIPVYNVEDYLDEAMQSLLTQSFSDYEIIAVNDGSTDGSLSILERYASEDKRITVISQSNQGQSAARNVALRHSSGNYIYFMDSDDSLKPESLQTCVDYMEQTQADFIFFDADMMYEQGASPIPWDYHRSHLCQPDVAYEGEKLLNLMLDTGKHSCVVWGLFIKKAYLDHIALTFYPGIIHEDELFTTLLTLQSHRIFCLQASLVNHRVRQASTMGHRYSARNVNCYLTVFDQLFQFQNSHITRKFARYTLSKVFYTAHLIPLKDKPQVFFRALRSGYLKYIGWKSTLIFWLK